MGMLTKDEAQKIAGAVNALRPDWSINGVMSVLADGRCRNRATDDLTIAFVALALDPKSRKPTRIYEHGPWWEILAPRVGSTVTYRTITDDDCAICSRPAHMHSVLSKVDPHEWEPQHARGFGVGPTEEQRAALEVARIEAEKKLTAERKPEPKREPRDPAEVINAHTTPAAPRDEATPTSVHPAAETTEEV